MEQKNLVSDVEHLKGGCERTLYMRNGQALTVKLKALSWEELSDLGDRIVRQTMDVKQQARAMIEASAGEPVEMTKLDFNSATLLHRTVLALNYGERSLKNVQAPEPSSPAPAACIEIAGNGNASLSPPAGLGPLSTDGAPLNLSSMSNSLSAAGRIEIEELSACKELPCEAMLMISKP